MGFINLGRLNIRKRNSCASALISLSDVQPPSVYKSHILNGLINKLYVSLDKMKISFFGQEKTNLFKANSGLPQSGKNVWKMNFFPGQGNVREFCGWPVKFRKDLESQAESLA